MEQQAREHLFGMAGLSKKPLSSFAKLGPSFTRNGRAIETSPQGDRRHKKRAYLEEDQWLRIAVDARQHGLLGRTATQTVGRAS